MHTPFFPNLPFAVAFVALLAGALGVAAWVDWKTLVVPKRLTLGLLAAGLLMSTARGAWRAAEGYGGWISGPGDTGLGGLDGLLFALAGFAVGFGLFFLFWVFGVAGGGDVKLVAAVGTWLGPAYVIGAVLMAVPFLMLLVVLRMGYRIMKGNINRPATTAAPGRRREMSFSLSFALGSAVIVAILLLVAVQTAQGTPPPAG
jgi:Flp pilus assembly protein protease CpaA